MEDKNENEAFLEEIDESKNEDESKSEAKEGNNQPSNNELKNKTFSGVLWKFAERFLAQGITFIVSLVLARILSPDDYGAVAIITIFIMIADVFLSSGFVMALIRKKEVTEQQLSSVFYLNLMISVVLYALIFFMAPLIAKLYENESLIWLLRIIALKLPVSAYNTVQCAIVSRNMQFKKFFFATFIGTITSAFVGIYMAYKGYGAWALIAQQLTNLVIDTICLMFVVKWHPRLMFSWHSIRNMLSFSTKNMATDLTGTAFNQLNAFVIGLKYSTADLAYYTKGQQLPNTINNTITSAVTSVLFPAIAKVSDNIDTVKKAERKSLKMMAFLLFPIMVGMAVVSKEFVLVFFTDKWNDMIIFMQLMSIDAIIGIMGAFDILTLRAIGKSNVALVLELIKKPILLASILISMQFGVLPIAITSLCYSVVALLINTIAIHKYTHYNLFEKIIDCLFPIIASGIMALAVLSLEFLPLDNIYLLLSLKVIVGVVIYLALCLFTKNSTYKEIKSMVFRKLKRS